MNTRALCGPEGRTIDLAAVTAADIDFDWIAETLAKIPRWGGKNPGAPFSVAQHCVMGANALHRETGDVRLAAAFLLHDAHEAFIGDFEVTVINYFDDDDVRSIIESVKRELDEEIAFAARMIVGMFSIAQVRAMDRRMALAEARALFGATDAQLAALGFDVRLDPPALTGAIKPWAWPKAADEYRAAFARLVGTKARETANV